MNAGTLVARLARGTAHKRTSLGTTRKARYGKDLKKALDNGTPYSVLEKAVDRIADRWDDTQLSLEDAIGDIERSGQVADVGSEERRTEGYEYLFGLSERQEKLEAEIRRLDGKDVSGVDLIDAILDEGFMAAHYKRSLGGKDEDTDSLNDGRQSTPLSETLSGESGDEPR